MAKEVHLLSYWMPLLRKIKEFQEIAKTEEPELRYILEAIDRTLNNLFIETADEYGIKRFEDMMGIIPNERDTLEMRRFRVLTEWNDYVSYTDVELFRRLVTICGSEDLFNIEEHYTDYWLRITTTLDEAGVFDLVADALREMIPCNLVLDLQNIIKANPFNTLYVGGVCCTSFLHCITNDINKEYQENGFIYSGAGLSRANTHIVTHDISSSMATEAALVGAMTQATAMVGIVTHDVELQDTTEAKAYGGIGAGTAHTHIITQDINSAVTGNGNHVVATSPNQATTITLY